MAITSKEINLYQLDQELGGKGLIADLNDDKKISGYEKARGKAIQKSMETKKGEKPKAQAQKTTKAAQKDEKKKVK
jgi:hypothetical protein